jgi:hypothetical protein
MVLAGRDARLDFQDREESCGNASHGYRHGCPGDDDVWITVSWYGFYFRSASGAASAGQRQCRTSANDERAFGSNSHATESAGD